MTAVHWERDDTIVVEWILTIFNIGTYWFTSKNKIINIHNIFSVTHQRRKDFFDAKFSLVSQWILAIENEILAPDFDKAAVLAQFLV